MQEKQPARLPISGPWTVALHAIECGMLGDQEKCRGYAELLLRQWEELYSLEQSGNARRYLQAMLCGETQRQTGKGPHYHLVSEQEGSRYG